MAHRYRYPTALRWSCRDAPAPRTGTCGPRSLRILTSVAETPIPLPSLPPGLDTPGLVVFMDRVRANIEGLQRDLDARGIALRPHTKTHKSVRLARMQVEAGAAGLTVGTLGEAEVFAAAGLRDLFLAYPLWADGPKAARLRALRETADVSVGVDSIGGAERLGAAVAGGRQPLRVLVEVDSGGHRTGAASPGEAVQVAIAATHAGLRVDGVFTHGGHGYRPAGAGAAALDEVASLEAAAAALEAAGFEVRTVSAGSTPTRMLAAEGRVTEIRAGTYILGDRQQVELGAIDGEGVAAVVAATVVSASSGRAVLDAGAKALTKDLPAFVEGYGAIPAWPGAIIERVYDYHGVVSVPGPGPAPALGSVVAIVPNHICPVVDLVSSFAAVQADGRVEHWAVDARGRSG